MDLPPLHLHSDAPNYHGTAMFIRVTITRITDPKNQLKPKKRYHPASIHVKAYIEYSQEPGEL